ncbi:MAG: homoserine kinase [Bdellovibrionales bacterium]
MSQYNKFSQEALTKFLEFYNLGVFRELVEESRDDASQNYIVYTSRGRFSLMVFDDRAWSDRTTCCVDLLDHLAQRKFPCRKPISRSDGSLYGRLEDGYAAVSNYPEGAPVTEVTSDLCADIGNVLAQLHNSGTDFQGQRRSALNPADWSHIAERVSCAASYEIAQTIHEELEFLRPRWPQNLPANIIHGQLTPHRVLINGDNISLVMGLETACNDMWALDLAMCLSAWCFETNGAFNLTKSCKLLQSYYKARKSISADELEALPVLARGAALDRLLKTLSSGTTQNNSHSSCELGQCMDVLRFHQMVDGAESYGLAT